EVLDSNDFRRTRTNETVITTVDRIQGRSSLTIWTSRKEVNFHGLSKGTVLLRNEASDKLRSIERVLLHLVSDISRARLILVRGELEVTCIEHVVLDLRTFDVIMHFCLTNR